MVTNSLLMWLEDEDDDKNGNKATFEPDDWTLAGTDTNTTPQQARQDVDSCKGMAMFTIKCSIMCCYVQHYVVMRNIMCCYV